MKNAEKKVSVLTVLQSKGFEPVVTSIKEKLPFLAEAQLLEVEMIHAMSADDYSAEENLAISEAIEECWKRIEQLKNEQPVLKRRPDDGKHSVAEGDLPEANTQLLIYCAENDDSVGGGAAALGDDGKWYWTHDWKLSQLCKYTVTHWRYL